MLAYVCFLSYSTTRPCPGHLPTWDPPSLLSAKNNSPHHSTCSLKDIFLSRGKAFQWLNLVNAHPLYFSRFCIILNGTFNLLLHEQCGLSPGCT